MVSREARDEIFSKPMFLDTSWIIMQAAEERRVAAQETLLGPQGQGQWQHLVVETAKRRHSLVADLIHAYQV